MLRRFWHYVWGPPLPDPTLAVLESLAKNQAKQAELFQAQIGLFEKWMAMFQQPSGSIPTDPDQRAEEMREMIALSARMGNDDAIDLMQDADRLESYIRLAINQ